VGSAPLLAASKARGAWATPFATTTWSLLWAVVHRVFYLLDEVEAQLLHERMVTAVSNPESPLDFCSFLPLRTDWTGRFSPVFNMKHRNRFVLSESFQVETPPVVSATFQGVIFSFGSGVPARSFRTFQPNLDAASSQRQFGISVSDSAVSSNVCILPPS
jgi:hypothetical protein